MTDENREFNAKFPRQVMNFPIELVFNPSKNYLFIYTQLFENLKSVITWSEMGQQTAQSKNGLLINGYKVSSLSQDLYSLLDVYFCYQLLLYYYTWLVAIGNKLTAK